MTVCIARGAGMALLILGFLGIHQLPTASAEPPSATKPAAAAPAKADAKKPLTAAVLKKPAPDFTLTDTDGKAVKLSSLRGKTVVLEWFNPDCPFVKYAHGKGPLKDASKRHQNDKLVWLTINSNAPGKQGHGAERNKQAKTEYAFDNRVLLDESGEVGRAYGAEKTPHVYVVDPKGVLVYRGGLDNAPMGVVDAQRPRLPDAGEGTLSPYLDAAIEDLGKKRALRLADTPAYGCTVKYAEG
ncbi:MAG: redoxin family protein [Polyangiales bacterium]